MNIIVNFSSIEELREFQRTVRIAGIDEKTDDRAVPKSGEADVQVPEAAPVPAVTEAPEAAIREPEAVPQSVPVAAPAPSSGSEKSEEKTQKKGITAAELKCIAADKARAGFRSQLKTLLSDYDAKSVTDLTEKHPEKMQEFYEKLEEVCDAG